VDYIRVANPGSGARRVFSPAAAHSSRSWAAQMFQHWEESGIPDTATACRSGADVPKGARLSTGYRTVMPGEPVSIPSSEEP
jgi:hypothetical protein